LKRWFDWRAGLVLSALPIVSLLLRAPDGVTAETRRVLRHELGLAQAAGWPAHLVMASGNERVLLDLGRQLWSGVGGRETFLLASENAAVLMPSQAFQDLPKSAHVAEYEDWLVEARRLQDLEGTVRILAWTFVTRLKQAGKMPASTPLASLPGLHFPSAVESPSASLDWGIPLAVLVPLALWLLRRRRSVLAQRLADEQSQLPEPGPQRIAAGKELS
jgi:hypothetical protein